MAHIIDPRMKKLSHKRVPQQQYVEAVWLNVSRVLEPCETFHIMNNFAQQKVSSTGVIKIVRLARAAQTFMVGAVTSVVMTNKRTGPVMSPNIALARQKCNPKSKNLYANKRWSVTYSERPVGEWCEHVFQPAIHVHSLQISPNIARHETWQPVRLASSRTVRPIPTNTRALFKHAFAMIKPPVVRAYSAHSPLYGDFT